MASTAVSPPNTGSLAPRGWSSRRASGGAFSMSATVAVCVSKTSRINSVLVSSPPGDEDQGNTHTGSCVIVFQHAGPSKTQAVRGKGKGDSVDSQITPCGKARCYHYTSMEALLTAAPRVTRTCLLLGAFTTSIGAHQNCFAQCLNGRPSQQPRSRPRRALGRHLEHAQLCPQRQR